MNCSRPERSDLGESLTVSGTVSVIIPVFNGASTISRSIRSALSEPETMEVIVVDDASVDDTVSRARAADDGSGRLKIFVQPQNLGPSAARNRAFAESKAPWIAVLDADDFFLPGRLARLLANADDTDLIADDIGQVAEEALDGPRKSLLRHSKVNASALGSHPVSFADFVLANVSRRQRQRCELGFIKPLIRRKFLNHHQLRYQEAMRLGEDYELYARALALGARFRLLPVEGYVSVVRARSLSTRHTETELLRLRDCDHALRQIPCLTAKDQKALRRHYLSVDCRLQWRLLINAVKKREVRPALATFMRPYPVPVHLLAYLMEQLAVRTLKKLGWRS